MSDWMFGPSRPPPPLVPQVCQLRPIPYGIPPPPPPIRPPPALPHHVIYNHQRFLHKDNENSHSNSRQPNHSYPQQQYIHQTTFQHSSNRFSTWHEGSTQQHSQISLNEHATGIPENKGFNQSKINMTHDLFNFTKPPPSHNMEPWRNQASHLPTSTSSIMSSSLPEFGGSGVVTLEVPIDEPKHPGQAKLKAWLEKRNAIRGSATKNVEPKMKILSVHEARELLLKGYNLLESLEKVQQSDIVNESDVCEVKEQLDNIVSCFSPAAVTNLAERLKNRKRKRARKRDREHEDEEMAQLRREALHAQIDAERSAVREKVLTAEREKEMKKNADSILSEVKKKLASSQKALNVLKALHKLRQIRKDNAAKRGFHVPEECDVLFKSRVSSSIAMLEKQHERYVSEEQTLQVMLETEHEKRRETAREANKDQEEKRRSRKRRRFLASLFGEEYSATADDPLFPFYMYYSQADVDVNSLVQIRREWDNYLVPDGSAIGSGIPPGWVVPSEPSSEAWTSALKFGNAE